MTAKDKLDERHLLALKKLHKASERKIYIHGLVICANAIAPNLNISPQTVINYLSGRAKDGFTTEQITKEFKTLNL